MKKILITSLILVLSLCTVHAEEKTFSKIRSPEPIPGTECTELKPQNSEDRNGMEAPSLWECKVETGTGQAIKTLGDMIRFFTIIASLLGVMFLVYSGILYSMGGIDQSLKDTAKKRIIQTLAGLLLLFASGYILQLIAPWIYK